MQKNISNLLLRFVDTIFTKDIGNRKKLSLHQVGNPIDAFAIETVNSDKVITGHLPRKISRVTKFLLDRGAVAYVKHSL